VKNVVLLFVTLASAYAFSKNLKDVSAAECKSANGNGAYISINMQTKLIVGRPGTLKNEMSNAQTGPKPTLEISEGYPSAEYTALGFLAADRTGYWGNLSLLSPRNAQLTETAKLLGFFTDANGRAQVEEMNCQLKF